MTTKGSSWDDEAEEEFEEDLKRESDYRRRRSNSILNSIGRFIDYDPDEDDDTNIET